MLPKIKSKVEMLYQFIKKNSRTILEIAGVVGIIVALIQLNLQQRQFAFEQQQFVIEQSQKPHLVFDYQVLLSDVDTKSLEKESRKLVDSMFDKLYEERINHPERDYSEILKGILPISTTIPPKAFTLVIIVKNQGASTASNVHVRFDVARPITSIEVKSLEPYEIIDGGIDYNKATLGIARIIPDAEVYIIVNSNKSSGEKQDLITIEYADSVTITLHPSGGTPPYTISTPTFLDFSNGPAITVHIDSSDSVPILDSKAFLPIIKYIPSDYTPPQIYISSDQGGANQLPLITPSPSP